MIKPVITIVVNKLITHSICRLIKLIKSSCIFIKLWKPYNNCVVTKLLASVKHIVKSAFSHSLIKIGYVSWCVSRFPARTKCSRHSVIPVCCKPRTHSSKTARIHKCKPLSCYALCLWYKCIVLYLINPVLCLTCICHI